jgi:hypothetical protein
MFVSISIRLPVVIVRMIIKETSPAFGTPAGSQQFFTLTRLIIANSCVYATGGMGRLILHVPIHFRLKEVKPLFQ